jgi:hypothetical protein
VRTVTHQGWQGLARARSRRLVDCVEQALSRPALIAYVVIDIVLSIVNLLATGWGMAPWPPH